MSRAESIQQRFTRLCKEYFYPTENISTNNDVLTAGGVTMGGTVAGAGGGGGNGAGGAGDSTAGGNSMMDDDGTNAVSGGYWSCRSRGLVDEACLREGFGGLGNWSTLTVGDYSNYYADDHQGLEGATSRGVAGGITSLDGALVGTGLSPRMLQGLRELGLLVASTGSVQTVSSSVQQHQQQSGGSSGRRRWSATTSTIQHNHGSRRSAAIDASHDRGIHAITAASSGSAAASNEMFAGVHKALHHLLQHLLARDRKLLLVRILATCLPWCYADDETRATLTFNFIAGVFPTSDAEVVRWALDVCRRAEDELDADAIDVNQELLRMAMEWTYLDAQRDRRLSALYILKAMIQRHPELVKSHIPDLLVSTWNPLKDATSSRVRELAAAVLEQLLILAHSHHPSFHSSIVTLQEKALRLVKSATTMLGITAMAGAGGLGKDGFVVADDVRAELYQQQLTDVGSSSSPSVATAAVAEALGVPLHAGTLAIGALVASFLVDREHTTKARALLRRSAIGEFALGNSEALAAAGGGGGGFTVDGNEMSWGSDLLLQPQRWIGRSADAFDLDVSDSDDYDRSDADVAGTPPPNLFRLPRHIATGVRDYNTSSTPTVSGDTSPGLEPSSAPNVPRLVPHLQSGQHRRNSSPIQAAAADPGASGGASHPAPGLLDRQSFVALVESILSCAVGPSSPYLGAKVTMFRLLPLLCEYDKTTFSDTFGKVALRSAVDQLSWILLADKDRRLYEKNPELYHQHRRSTISTTGLLFFAVGDGLPIELDLLDRAFTLLTTAIEDGKSAPDLALFSISLILQAIEHHATRELYIPIAQNAIFQTLRSGSLSRDTVEGIVRVSSALPDLRAATDARLLRAVERVLLTTATDDQSGNGSSGGAANMTNASSHYLNTSNNPTIHLLDVVGTPVDVVGQEMQAVPPMESAILIESQLIALQLLLARQQLWPGASSILQRCVLPFFYHENIALRRAAVAAVANVVSMDCHLCESGDAAGGGGGDGGGAHPTAFGVASNYPMSVAASSILQNRSAAAVPYQHHHSATIATRHSGRHHVATLAACVTALLELCVTDSDPGTRLETILALRPSMDTIISSSELARRALFEVLHDEHSANRIAAVHVMQRLAIINPSEISPTLRSLFFQLLSDLQDPLCQLQEPQLLLLFHVVQSVDSFVSLYVPKLCSLLLSVLNRAEASPKACSIVCEIIQCVVDSDRDDQVHQFSPFIPVLSRRLSDLTSDAVALSIVLALQDIIKALLASQYDLSSAPSALTSSPAGAVGSTGGSVSASPSRANGATVAASSSMSTVLMPLHSSLDYLVPLLHGLLQRKPSPGPALSVAVMSLLGSLSMTEAHFSSRNVDPFVWGGGPQAIGSWDTKKMNGGGEQQVIEPLVVVHAEGRAAWPHKVMRILHNFIAGMTGSITEDDASAALRATVALFQEPDVRQSLYIYFHPMIRLWRRVLDENPGDVALLKVFFTYVASVLEVCGRDVYPVAGVIVSLVKEHWNLHQPAVLCKICDMISILNANLTEPLRESSASFLSALLNAAVHYCESPNGEEVTMKIMLAVESLIPAVTENSTGIVIPLLCHMLTLKLHADAVASSAARILVSLVFQCNVTHFISLLTDTCLDYIKMCDDAEKEFAALQQPYVTSRGNTFSPLAGGEGGSNSTAMRLPSPPPAQYPSNLSSPGVASSAASPFGADSGDGNRTSGNQKSGWWLSKILRKPSTLFGGKPSSTSDSTTASFDRRVDVATSGRPDKNTKRQQLSPAQRAKQIQQLHAEARCGLPTSCLARISGVDLATQRPKYYPTGADDTTLWHAPSEIEVFAVLCAVAGRCHFYFDHYHRVAAVALENRFSSTTSTALKFFNSCKKQRDRLRLAPYPLSSSQGDNTSSGAHVVTSSLRMPSEISSSVGRPNNNNNNNSNNNNNTLFFSSQVTERAGPNVSFVSSTTTVVWNENGGGGAVGGDPSSFCSASPHNSSQAATSGGGANRSMSSAPLLIQITHGGPTSSAKDQKTRATSPTPGLQLNSGDERSNMGQPQPGSSPMRGGGGGGGSSYDLVFRRLWSQARQPRVTIDWSQWLDHLAQHVIAHSKLRFLSSCQGIARRHQRLTFSLFPLALLSYIADCGSVEEAQNIVSDLKLVCDLHFPWSGAASAAAASGGTTSSTRHSGLHTPHIAAAASVSAATGGVGAGGGSAVASRMPLPVMRELCEAAHVLRQSSNLLPFDLAGILTNQFMTRACALSLCVSTAILYAERYVAESGRWDAAADLCALYDHALFRVDALTLANHPSLKSYVTHLTSTTVGGGGGVSATLRCSAFLDTIHQASSALKILEPLITRALTNNSSNSGGAAAYWGPRRSSNTNTSHHHHPHMAQAGSSSSGFSQSPISFIPMSPVVTHAQAFAAYFKQLNHVFDYSQVLTLWSAVKQHAAELPHVSMSELASQAALAAQSLGQWDCVADAVQYINRSRQRHVWAAAVGIHHGDSNETERAIEYLRELLQQSASALHNGTAQMRQELNLLFQHISDFDESLHMRGGGGGGYQGAKLRRIGARPLPPTSSIAERFQSLSLRSLIVPLDTQLTSLFELAAQLSSEGLMRTGMNLLESCLTDASLSVDAHRAIRIEHLKYKIRHARTGTAVGKVQSEIETEIRDLLSKRMMSDQQQQRLPPSSSNTTMSSTFPSVDAADFLTSPGPDAQASGIGIENESSLHNVSLLSEWAGYYTELGLLSLLCHRRKLDINCRDSIYVASSRSMGLSLSSSTTSLRQQQQQLVMRTWWQCGSEVMRVGPHIVLLGRYDIIGLNDVFQRAQQLVSQEEAAGKAATWRDFGLLFFELHAAKVQKYLMCPDPEYLPIHRVEVGDVASALRRALKLWDAATVFSGVGWNFSSNRRVLTARKFLPASHIYVKLLYLAASTDTFQDLPFSQDMLAGWAAVAPFLCNYAARYRPLSERVITACQQSLPLLRQLLFHLLSNFEEEFEPDEFYEKIQETVELLQMQTSAVPFSNAANSIMSPVMPVRGAFPPGNAIGSSAGQGTVTNVTSGTALDPSDELVSVAPETLSVPPPYSNAVQHNQNRHDVRGAAKLQTAASSSVSTLPSSAILPTAGQQITTISARSSQLQQGGPSARGNNGNGLNSSSTRLPRVCSTALLVPTEDVWWVQQQDHHEASVTAAPTPSIPAAAAVPHNQPLLPGVTSEAELCFMNDSWTESVMSPQRKTEQQFTTAMGATATPRQQSHSHHAPAATSGARELVSPEMRQFPVLHSRTHSRTQSGPSPDGFTISSKFGRSEIGGPATPTASNSFRRDVAATPTGGAATGPLLPRRSAMSSFLFRIAKSGHAHRKVIHGALRFAQFAVGRDQELELLDCPIPIPCWHLPTSFALSDSSNGSGSLNGGGGGGGAPITIREAKRKIVLKPAPPYRREDIIRVRLSDGTKLHYHYGVWVDRRNNNNTVSNCMGGGSAAAASASAIPLHASSSSTDAARLLNLECRLFCKCRARRGYEDYSPSSHQKYAGGGEGHGGSLFETNPSWNTTGSSSSPPAVEACQAPTAILEASMSVFLEHLPILYARRSSIIPLSRQRFLTQLVPQPLRSEDQAVQRVNELMTTAPSSLYHLLSGKDPGALSSAKAASFNQACDGGDDPIAHLNNLFETGAAATALSGGGGGGGGGAAPFADGAGNEGRATKNGGPASPVGRKPSPCSTAGGRGDSPSTSSATTTQLRDVDDDDDDGETDSPALRFEVRLNLLKRHIAAESSASGGGAYHARLRHQAMDQAPDVSKWLSVRSNLMKQLADWSMLQALLDTSCRSPAMVHLDLATGAVTHLELGSHSLVPAEDDRYENDAMHHHQERRGSSGNGSPPAPLRKQHGQPDSSPTLGGSAAFSTGTIRNSNSASDAVQWPSSIHSGGAAGRGQQQHHGGGSVWSTRDPTGFRLTPALVHLLPFDSPHQGFMYHCSEMLVNMYTMKRDISGFAQYGLGSILVLPPSHHSVGGTGQYSSPYSSPQQQAHALTAGGRIRSPSEPQRRETSPFPDGSSQPLISIIPADGPALPAPAGRRGTSPGFTDFSVPPPLAPQNHHRMPSVSSSTAQHPPHQPPAAVTNGMDLSEDDLRFKMFHVMPLLARLQEHLPLAEAYTPAASSVYSEAEEAGLGLRTGSGLQVARSGEATAAQAASHGTAAVGGSMDSNLSDHMMLLMSVRDSNATRIQRAFRSHLAQKRRDGTGHAAAEGSTRSQQVDTTETPGTCTRGPRCRTVQDRVQLLIAQATSEANHVSLVWGGAKGMAHPWMSWAPYW